MGGYAGLTQLQGSRRPRSVHTIRAASNSEDKIGTWGTAAVASGALANPLVLLSDYVLFSTGRGLPEGPGGKYILILHALSLFVIDWHLLAACIALELVLREPSSV